MLDVPTFQAAFREYRETSPTVIAATLARAQRWVSPAVWGDKTDDGVALLTAHWLACAPSGNATALKAEPWTIYKTLFDEMRLAVVGGFAGGSPWLH